MHILFDENFDHNIIRGLVRRKPDLDYARVQDIGLRTASDPIILEWAAQNGYVLFTHDAETMVDHAYDRVRAGQRMPGVFEVRQELGEGLVIGDILLVVECSKPDE